MIRETLSARAVAERYAKRKPQKKGRASYLACYVPPAPDGELREGADQASRLITGAHLDKDGPEMRAAANLFAGALLDAISSSSQPTRTLLGPAKYGDQVLEHYCSTLIRGALGKPGADVVSPALVPYLLGGVPLKTLEELCHRATEVMEFFPEPLSRYTLANTLQVVGFGAHIPHIHHDECFDDSYVEPTRKYNHLSHRQEYILNLPRTGSYARILIDQGAYQCTLRRTLTSHKLEIMHTVERLLDPAGGEMTELAARKRKPLDVTPLMFTRAVRKVFEKPWSELDLIGTQDGIFQDAEVLIARQIIHKLTRKANQKEKMSATSLVGMSLLTGISMAAFVEFAVYDLRRRGETFITAEAIEEAIAMVEVSPYFRCEGELRSALTEIRYHPLEKARWARRLRSPSRPLWSTKGDFYVNGMDVNGVATFKFKPYSISTD